MFGGNGVGKEYPVEKLLRDARASMIADGCNEMLALKGGAQLINPELFSAQFAVSVALKDWWVSVYDRVATYYSLVIYTFRVGR